MFLEFEGVQLSYRKGNISIHKKIYFMGIGLFDFPKIYIIHRNVKNNN